MEKEREINDGKTLLNSTQLEKGLGHPLELFLEIPEQQNSGEKNSPLLFTQRDLFCVHNTVFLDIDCREAVVAQEKKWNGFWGVLPQVRERDGLSITVGSESLRMFSCDSRTVIAPNIGVRQMAERVLRKCSLELNYPVADSYKAEKPLIVQCRSP